MPAARRQHRASPRSPKAVNGRGIANALALLYADAPPLQESEVVATWHALAETPYRKPQGALPLVFHEPDECP